MKYRANLYQMLVNIHTSILYLNDSNIAKYEKNADVKFQKNNEGIMKFVEEVNQIIKKEKENSRENISSAFNDGKYSGEFFRMNQEQGYEAKFNTILTRRNIIRDVIIESDKIKNISKNMFHIPMSPKNKKYFELCYLIPDNHDASLNEHGILNILNNPEQFYLNETLDRVNAFFDLLVKKANKLKLVENTDFEFSKFAIIGPPGIGKTALINYIFSTKYANLDEERIIFARIDLNNISLKDNGLNERFCSKVLRIIAKYYCGKYIDCIQIHEDFKTFFKQSYYFDDIKYFDCSETQKEELFEYFMERLRGLHYEKFSERDFAIKTLEKKNEGSELVVKSNDLCIMVKILLSFLQKKKNWGFIFVFDGFDNVNYDQIKNELFESWYSKLVELSTVKDNIFYKAVHIVTLRDYSYVRLLNVNMHEEYDTTGQDRLLPGFKLLKIKQRDIEKIIEARFNYFVMKELISEEESKNLKRNLINLIYMCYESTDPQIALHSNWDMIREMLDDLFCYNYRLFFYFMQQLLKLIWIEKKDRCNVILFGRPEEQELLKSFKGMEWKIVKLFLYGTVKRVLFKNKRKYDRNGQPVPEDASPIIPNVFHFNEYSTNTRLCDNASDPAAMQNKILCKIRILQYLENHGDTCRVTDIIKDLCKMFGNNWGHETVHEIRDLIYNNVVKCETDFVEQADIDFEAITPDRLRKDNYKITRTSKAKVILKMLGTNTYYEVVMDNSPVDLRLKKYFYPLQREEKNDLWDYLREKTSLIIRFLEYLYEIEDQEKDEFINNDYNGNNIQERKIKYEDGYLIFNGVTKENIEETINKYLHGFLNSLNNDDIASNLIRTWKDGIE